MQELEQWNRAVDCECIIIIQGRRWHVYVSGMQMAAPGTFLLVYNAVTTSHKSLIV